MALKTWHRAALTAGGMALALAVILPSRPYPEPGEALSALYPVEYWWWRTQYRNTLDNTLFDLRNRHRAAVMADSLFALTNGPRAVKSADGALTVLYEQPLGADSARVWLAMLERELALAPRGTGAGVPVVVALKSAPSKRNPRGAEGEAVGRDGAAREDPWVAMRFVSPRAERPTCFVALRLVDLKPGQNANPGELIERDSRTGAARTAVLDRCLIYARFGVPGAQVERWAGRRVDVRRWWSQGDNLSWALEAGRQSRARDEMISNLSPRELSDYWADPLNSSCVRGSSVLCLKSVGLIADPTLRGESYWMGNVRRSLIAELILKDPARFERFWRSAEPPTVALEKAYGRPAGEIVGEWKRSAFSVPALGPRTPALLSSLGWAVLAIGLSLLTAHRRQVSS
ncbi:MAG: hypothetical protein ACHQX4_09815 [Gemmatimonadales bacterium]